MTTTSTAPSIQVIAQQGDEIFSKIMAAEPTVATIASALIPGAAPVLAMVQPELLILAPLIDKALKDIAASTSTGDAISAGAGALLTLIMHLSKGLPNSPVLGPTAAPAWTQSESAQGSG